MLKKIIWISILACLTSCAYYNTFYNAELYYEKGLKDYEESLEKNNTNFSKKNFNLAIEKSEKVLVNYPDSKWCDDAQYLIAVSNYYKANYRKAKGEIENFFNNYPNSDLTQDMKIWYGRVLWKMGSPEMAIHHWQQMAPSVDDNELKANIYYQIGEVFREIGNTDSAIYYFDKTTNVRGGSDKHGQAKYNIAELYFDMGEMDKAVENVEEVEQFNIDTDLKQKRQILLLKIYRMAGQYDKAEKLIFKKLNDEKNKEIWDELELELGLLYRAVGDTAAALSRMKKITETKEYEKTRSSAAAFYYIGLINLVDVHNYKEAEKNFALVQKENKQSEFVFDANQRTQQLKRFDKIQTSLQEKKEIVQHIISELNKPEDIGAEIDTVDKTQEEIKQDLEEAEKQKNYASIDTLATFEEYYKFRYELAEIYYFDFNFKDSAKVIFDDIVHSQYFNPYVEQSLYALYYINKLEKNEDKAEFYFNELKAVNPESPFISFIKTGQIIIKDKYEKEKGIFTEAESYLETDPEKAISLFKLLIEKYPQNPYQGKSAANIAWIMENKKYDLDSSLYWYKTVIDSFPGDEVVAMAKEKYNLLHQLVVDQETPPDSLAVTADNDSVSTAETQQDTVVDVKSDEEKQLEEARKREKIIESAEKELQERMEKRKRQQPDTPDSTGKNIKLN